MTRLFDLIADADGILVTYVTNGESECFRPNYWCTEGWREDGDLYLEMDGEDGIEDLVYFSRSDMEKTQEIEPGLFLIPCTEEGIDYRV